MGLKLEVVSAGYVLEIISSNKKLIDSQWFSRQKSEVLRWGILHILYSISIAHSPEHTGGVRVSRRWA